MPDAFVPPDFNAPLDIDAIVAGIPDKAMVKGMFFCTIQQQVRRHDGMPLGREKYVAFRDYTVREHVRFLADCARVTYPNQPIRQALRQLGREAYRIFLNSTIGKVLFTLAARDFEHALHLTSKAYKVVGSLSSATIEDEQARSAVVHLRGVWNLPDCYHVGVFEEAAADYKKEVQVLLKANGPDDVELKLLW